MNLRQPLLPIAVFTVLMLSACSSTRTAGTAPVAPDAHANVPADYMEARNVQFPVDQGVFPQMKGYDKFAASCTICHSLRYIEMQPNFPKTTWAKVVHKMVTTYGAPISDADADEIIDYLATIKGKPEAPK